MRYQLFQSGKTQDSNSKTRLIEKLRRMGWTVLRPDNTGFGITLSLVIIHPDKRRIWMR